MGSPEEPTREMLYQAYLSHLQHNPRSALRRIPFSQCLDNRAIYICLKNLAQIAARKRAAQPKRESPPPLELT